MNPDIDHWMNAFFDQVREEFVRARRMFPGNQLTTVAMAEEFGELVKAAMDENRFRVRMEAVQTTVMCMRLLFDGDAQVNVKRISKCLEALGDDHRE